MQISERLKRILNNIWIFLKISVLGAIIFFVGWTINRFKKKKEDFKKELKEIEKKIKEQEAKAKEIEKRRKEIEKNLAQRKKEYEEKFLKASKKK